MPRKTTIEEDQGDVEFVPSPVLVEAMNEEGTGTPEQIAHFDALNTPPDPTYQEKIEQLVGPPERYRELRPWNRDTLAQRLNEAATDGWRLAAVVGNQIVLERVD